MKDSIPVLGNVKIWSTADMNNTGSLALAKLDLDPSKIVYGKSKVVRTALEHYQSKSPTAARLLLKIGQKSTEIVIVHVSSGVGGGFVHKGASTADHHLITWCSSDQYSFKPTDIQYGHKIADPATAVSNRIHLPKGYAYVDKNLPSALVLIHELGHAFQYLYAEDKFIAAYATDGSTRTLDSLNIPFVERAILKECAKLDHNFYALRDAYGGTKLSAGIKASSPAAWNYGELTSYTGNDPKVLLGNYDEAYDPSDPAKLMSKKKQRYDENGYSVLP